MNQLAQQLERGMCGIKLDASTPILQVVKHVSSESINKTFAISESFLKWLDVFTTSIEFRKQIFL